ncbi:MAG TPA: hypothetical protein VNI61_10455 [Gemmatimonadales bacterium]|nr:hypothetical protein [Gemmatimonadales bacterium]
MSSGPRFGVWTVTLATAVLAASCAINRLDRRLVPPSEAATLDGTSPYLKAHLRDGHVYVLSGWRRDGGAIVGRGQLLDPNRALVAEGEFRLPADSVALFETNVVRPSGARIALTLMAGVTAAVATICLTNPKACFGSCPTFYAADSAGEALQAEGFSASIAPALEATDVDMLYRARPRGRDFVLRLTNEALETHVIRYADVLVARRPPGGRVFVTPDGQFRGAWGLRAPSRCRAEAGDCRDAVLAFDGRERSSPADSTDLAARELVELEFDSAPPGPVGLAIGARQSLLTTFLMYQGLAYLGREAGRWLAALETAGPAVRERAAGLGRHLGGIEVLVPDAAGGWVSVGVVGETGPLAVDTKIVPLPPSVGGARRVRLRLTRGLWRLEYAALAALGDTVPVLRLRPHRTLRAGRADPAALAALRDSAGALTTLPGDEYRLVYRLPKDPGAYELFLEARGYYIEWMRREWVAEENPALALRMFTDPAGTLRALAPAYKRLEPEMERVFWGSRYAAR